MLIDSFFEQGVTHEVCEDYARHGDEYVVLADGCSNGGGPRIDTDWGARILCLSAEASLPRSLRSGDYSYKPEDSLEFLWRIIENAQSYYSFLLPTPPEGMCATLLTLRPIHDYLQAMIIGDGVTGGKRKDGSWVIRSVEFSNSAPYYLKYRMFADEQSWWETYGKNYTLTTYTGNLHDPTLEFTEWSPEREHAWKSVMTVEIETKEWDLSPPFLSFTYPLDEFEFAFIASDGLHSFYHPRKTQTNKHNEPIHVLDVLRVLLDIRGYRPGFMRLQRHWNFRQDRPGTFKRRNWQHGDDVSMGAIYCGQQ
jgi:hypothetical protein